MKSETSVPQGMPQLAAGKHFVREDGACLMEYVSVLAGERFTDHPLCVHPTLAAVARVVNDRLSEEQRNRMAVLAPTFIGTAGADARVTEAILLHCVRFLEPGRSRDKAMRQLERRAERIRGPLFAGLDRMRMRRLGLRVLLRVAEHRTAGDREYARLLSDSLNAARTLTAREPRPVSATRA